MSTENSTTTYHGTAADPEERDDINVLIREMSGYGIKVDRVGEIASFMVEAESSTLAVLVNKGRAGIMAPADLVPVVKTPELFMEPGPRVITPETAQAMVTAAVNDKAKQRNNVNEIFLFVARRGVLWSLPIGYLAAVADGSYLVPSIN